MIVPSSSEAAGLVEQAFARDGRQADDVTLVVLLGSGGGAILQALLEQAPNLVKVLVLEPDAGSAARLRALKASDARLAERLVINGPEELQPAHDFVAAYLTIGQFLLGSQLSPQSLCSVVDPAALETVVGRALSSAIFDLTRGLSRDFLRLVAGRPEFASVLNALGQFFAARGEHYTALKFFSSVAPQKMNAGLVQAGFACLLALGNAELCEHWLMAMPLDLPSRHALREQIPEGFQALKREQEARLERNLSFLEPHFPAAVATLRGVERAPDLFAIELDQQPWRITFGHEWTTKRRPYQLLVRARGLSFSEENPLTELEELNDALVKCAMQGQDHVWIGGWVKHAMFVVNLIAEPSLLKLHGWRRVTFLQEADASALVSWLSAVELQPWFDCEQVRLSVGASSAAEQVATLVGNLHQAVPELGIGLPPDAKRQVLQQRLRRLAAAPERFSALERRYQQHPERLRAVLEGGHRPLKIALMTSRYTTVLQHVTRDLADGFEQLGHQTFVLHEQRAGEALIAFGVAERLLELEPDLMFVIDHVRPDYAGLLPSGMPVVSWVLDELPSLKDPRTISQLGGLDLTYGFNGAIERGFRALGYPNVGRLPFAVNPARYFPEPPLASASGVAFTTHIGQFSDDPPAAPGLNALLARAFDAAPEIPLEMFKIAPLLDAALGQLGRHASEEAKRHLLYHGLQLARQQDRERVAQRIVKAGLPLTVYGLGWDSMPEFADKSGGVVEPGPALRQIYRQHSVVLHINRGCNIHPRVLETLCSGGLVVARWDPVDDEPGETCDQLGDSLPLFRNHEQMVQLLERATRDPAFRNEQILRGQARVLREHTYQARARKIIADLLPLLQRHLQEPAAASAALDEPARSAHA